MHFLRSASISFFALKLIILIGSYKVEFANLDNKKSRSKIVYTLVGYPWVATNLGTIPGSRRAPPFEMNVEMQWEQFTFFQRFRTCEYQSS